MSINFKGIISNKIRNFIEESRSSWDQKDNKFNKTEEYLLSDNLPVSDTIPILSLTQKKGRNPVKLYSSYSSNNMYSEYFMKEKIGKVKKKIENKLNERRNWTLSKRSNSSHIPWPKNSGYMDSLRRKFLNKVPQKEIKEQTDLVKTIQFDLDRKWRKSR